MFGLLLDGRLKPVALRRDEEGLDSRCERGDMLTTLQKNVNEVWVKTFNEPQFKLPFARPKNRIGAQDNRLLREFLFNYN
ncbi:hypothetical protein QW180_03230 [Vibrio sinaloensis]|nr:hypothetical protein [Vibrio sinaloensis]